MSHSRISRGALQKRVEREKSERRVLPKERGSAAKTPGVGAEKKERRAIEGPALLHATGQEGRAETPVLGEANPLDLLLSQSQVRGGHRRHWRLHLVSLRGQLSTTVGIRTGKNPKPEGKEKRSVSVAGTSNFTVPTPSEKQTGEQSVDETEETGSSRGSTA